MRFSLLIISLLLFLSCDEELEFNPLDPENNPNFVEPETTIMVTNLDGGTIDTSSVTITYGGNDLVIEYAYRIDGDELAYVDSGEYSDWTTSTSVTYDYLNEGDYTFSVKGRYITGDEDPTPATANFLVDMVGENGIRVYPLLIEMASGGPGSWCYIMSEEVEDLVFFSFQIQYDPDKLSIDVEQIIRGALIVDIIDYIFLPKEISTGLIEVSFTALGSAGVSGTSPMIKLPFYSNIIAPPIMTSLKIINPQYGYIDGSVETVTESANGTVVVQ